MVIYCGQLLCLALFFLLAVHESGIAVQVEASIEGNTAVAGQPLKGMLTVTHEKKEAVDADSAKMENKPLHLEQLKEVRFSPDSPLILSLYRFELPAQEPGLHLLPAVSLLVGGKEYRSIRSSYEVKEGSPLPSAPTPSAVPEVESAPALRLEASIEGRSTLYPGQLTKLVYRYFYRGDIQLVTEKIPLLDAKGMRKIGEKESKDYAAEGLNVNEISQMVEAVNPGVYTYGPSLIEGYAYVQGMFGTRARTSDKLSSESAPITLTVLPFPAANKPASFNGAVGTYTFEVSLPSSGTLAVGSEFILEMAIKGEGYIRGVPVPDLCCQPGFSGFFRISDLPPAEQVEGDTKKARYKLRPASSEIKKIPSIAFSFFDPEKEEYVTRHSPPIPIEIKPVKESLAAAKKRNKFEKNAVGTIEKDSEPIQHYAPVPLEIESGMHLTSRDLHNKLFGSTHALWIVPALLALLLYQWHVTRYLETSKQTPYRASSRELFRKAFSKNQAPSLSFKLLEESLKQALLEQGLVAAPSVAGERLSVTGVAGEVQHLLDTIDEGRFSGGVFDLSSIQEEARALYQKITGATP
jgi:hypothetical protein